MATKRSGRAALVLAAEVGRFIDDCDDRQTDEFLLANGIDPQTGKPLERTKNPQPPFEASILLAPTTTFVRPDERYTRVWD